MDSLSRVYIGTFDTEYYLSIASIAFRYSGNVIYFFMTEGTHFASVLKHTDPSHKKIIEFLKTKVLDNGILKIQRTNRKTMYVTCPVHIRSICFINTILTRIFDYCVAEICYDTNNLKSNECDLHLLDFIELGYLSNKKVIRDNKQEYLFMGLDVYATTPSGSPLFQYDNIESNMSKHTIEFKASLKYFITHRPFMEKRITKLIESIIGELPTTTEEKKDLILSWNQSHTIDFFTYNAHLYEWKSFVYISYLSKLLDIFPTYKITSDFTLEIEMEPYYTFYQKEYKNLLII